MTRLRQNLNIELAEGNKDKLETVRSWNGMTQKELVGRLINWFASQDRVTQQVILGQIPDEIAPDVAQLLLQRIAARRKAKGEDGISSMVGEVSTQAQRGSAPSSTPQHETNGTK